MDPVISTLLAEWDALSQLITQVPEDQWLQPSILPYWTNFDILAHIVGTERFLNGEAPFDGPLPTDRHYPNEVAQLNDRWLITLRRLSVAELLATYHNTIAERTQALSSLSNTDLDTIGWTPIGQAPFRRFLQIRIFDCWVHEQDLRLSLGMPGHTSGVVVEASIDEVERALGYIIGKQANLPQGTTVELSLTGGAPRTWHIEVGERARLVPALANVTCRLQIDSTLFMALACGRIDRDHADGSITIDGDQTLADHIIDNLAFTI
ncbi:maleylpyruvate isomerase family mycothiol-dependent enzyme [Ferrimicrobium sp.]|uniref:maleylpyruvate isomerase family mycothiol-dependent enzyme n=1 Tax=Ferrimicrobium sp. TaxID=2926050 RepID=UPI002635DACA|nr:maleylpyruvate isomerase family mycothiol-dependent enzyme [Ferrimicrobium sp.]